MSAGKRRRGNPDPGSAGQHWTAPQGAAVHGIDRLVRNVRTGRFERSLSALTAAGALVTAAEIYFEHGGGRAGRCGGR
jgi:hypothetical protein